MVYLPTTSTNSSSKFALLLQDVYELGHYFAAFQSFLDS